MIEMLALVVVVFMLWQGLNVFINFLFQHRLKENQTSQEEKISVLIPARNEVRNVNVLLADLMRCKENIEIIVYDDNSTDATADVVLNAAQRDKRITLIKGGELPQGWQGKPHACHELAMRATGAYYLFLDADVRLLPGIIGDSVSYFKKKHLSLLSVFPQQILESKGEKTTVPVMNYILLTLLPLVFVRYSPFKAHSAANGQFMLFEANKYRQLQPHLAQKEAVVEDIAIAKSYKKQKEKVACLIGNEKIQCRMYDSYSAALEGFSKNVLSFFGNSMVFALLYAVINSMGFIIVFSLGWEILVTFALMQSVILLMISFLSKINPFVTVVYFPFHMVFLWQLIIRHFRVKRTKTIQWKGRDISL